MAMAVDVLKNLVRKRLLQQAMLAPLAYQSKRCLTSGEVATALRPFYFSVHPDLFGKFPAERATNESSLQLLSSYLQTLQQNRPPRPATLRFYLRPQGGLIKEKENLKAVSIRLAQRDIRKTVTSILSSCDLPTTYVDKLPAPINPPYSPDFKFRNTNPFHQAQAREEPVSDDPESINVHIRRTKDQERLLDWLARNVDSAKMKLAACEPVREEVVRLRKELSDRLGLLDVTWECGWNITHFRGCLQAFQALADHHNEAMSSLKGRKLVFGSDTGISREGHVFLNSGEVRNNWLDSIKNSFKQDAALKTVPHFEKALSRVLRDIKVVRRKFQQQTMVNNYENNLRRLTTTLSDCLGRSGFPKSWPESLSDFELVVESEAGPLMVSPTGQFIVPCSIPSFLIVNFLTENMEKASTLLSQYKKQKNIEKELHANCISDLQLIALDKDDSITPQPMIVCCEKLLANKAEISSFLVGTRITVTNYFSVMYDGQMCIPWNWKL